MSMTQITVASIEYREVNTRYGPKKVYSIVSTDGNKYNYGFEEPSKRGLAAGTTFNGFVDSDKFGPKVDPKSITLGKAAGVNPLPPAPSAETATKAAGKYGNFPVGTRDGSMSIIRQNSVTNATSIVADFIATTEKDTWPKTLDEFTEMVITVAYKLTDFSSGQREEKLAKKLAGEAALKRAMNDPDDDEEGADE